MSEETREAINNIQTEINKRKKLIKRIKKAAENVDSNNDNCVELTKEDMLELLKITAGNEDFYNSSFEIRWCGFKCKLWYGAENHNNITGSIESAIEEENE